MDKVGALLDLMLTNKELVGRVKVMGNLGCSDHDIVEFRRGEPLRPLEKSGVKTDHP